MQNATKIATQNATKIATQKASQNASQNALRSYIAKFISSERFATLIPGLRRFGGRVANLSLVPPEQYLGPRRKGVKDHQFHKIAMTKRSLTL